MVDFIKPSDLPAASTVYDDDAIVVDNSGLVQKATPVQVVNAGAPVASQAEAIAGTDNTKRMTALRVRQVLDDETAPSVLRAQAWAEASGEPDPAIPGSKSSKSWANEAEIARDETVNAAPFAVNDAADFFAKTDLVKGARYWSKDGMAWDVVESGDGNFNHPVAGLGVIVVPGADGKASVLAFGCVLDGETDDTEAFQTAHYSGIPLTGPIGEMLLTDTIKLLPGAHFEGAGGVALYDDSPTKIRFHPETKRDLFVWDTAPTTNVFAGVTLTGFCVRGFGPGADAVLDLPRLYNGRLDFFTYAGFDIWMRIKRWMDTDVRGGCQGFRVAGVKFDKSGSGGASDVTTTTRINAYVSQGPTAYVAEDNAVTDVKISGVVESVDGALDQARGNVIFMDVYTENAPRTDAGSPFKVGKRGTSPISSTALHLTLRPGIGFSTGAAPANCVLLDVDAARFVKISGYAFLYGALLATTSNTECVILSDLDTGNCPWLSLAGGIADMSAITAIGFRPRNMQTRGDNFFSEYRLASSDLELISRPRSTVTRRKLFVDSSFSDKMIRRDNVGNFTAPIGMLRTSVNSGWTFNGGRLVPGELVAHDTSLAGQVALWRSQRHTKDVGNSYSACSTVDGSPVISRTGGFSPTEVGDWVTMSAGFPSTTTQYRVVSRASDYSTITVDTNATSTVSGTVTVATEAHQLVPIAAQGFRQAAVSPASLVTPYFVGQEYLDTSTGDWWKSTGLTTSDWKKIT